MGWLRRRRDRLTSEVVLLGEIRFRVTKQRGRIVGIERWVPMISGDGWYYTVWKEGLR